jgi:hypothetical protein
MTASATSSAMKMRMNPASYATTASKTRGVGAARGIVDASRSPRRPRRAQRTQMP